MTAKVKFRAIYKRLFTMFLIVLLTFSYAHSQVKKNVCNVVLQNTGDFSRSDEVITISRKNFGKISDDYYPEIKKGTKTYISQLTDDDLDGQWDNLLIQVSLKPNSKDTLRINWVKLGQQTSFPKMTNVRFSLKTKTTDPEKEISSLTRLRGFTQNIADPVYQMEGPAIENDRLAFRTFFDIRNSQDIYGKVTNKPILEKVGVGASWHIMQDWGMDIFKTGNSLGAGGLAIEENKKFYRLADADTTIFQALYEGPLKAAFRLTFKNWDVGTGHSDGTEVISMTKGNYYYQNDITVALKPNQQLLAGIANFNPDSLIYKKHNAKYSSVSVYGAQAEGTKTKLGVAVLFPANGYAASHTISNSDVMPNTSYVEFKDLPVGKKTIYFAACWEITDPRFNTLAAFYDYLDITARILKNPINAKIVYSKY